MVKLTVKPIKGDEFQIDAEWTQTVSLAVKTETKCRSPTLRLM